MIRKWVVIIALPLVLNACGIQRPLVLPQNDKYKHHTPAPDTPATTAPSTTVTAPTVTVAPPTTTAPTSAIEK